MRATTKVLLASLVVLGSYVALDPSAPRVGARPTPAESSRALYQDRERLEVAIEALVVTKVDPWGLILPGETTQADADRGLQILRGEYRGRYGDAP